MNVQPADRGRVLARIFPGDGAVASRLRAFDWTSTSVGAPEEWPEPLVANLPLLRNIPRLHKFSQAICFGLRAHTKLAQSLADLRLACRPAPPRDIGTLNQQITGAGAQHIEGT